MSDAPHLVLLPDAAGAVCCSPEEWVAHAAALTAAGVRKVVLDDIPDGSPWNDAPAFPDPVTGVWVFDPWPGVAFTLPLD